MIQDVERKMRSCTLNILLPSCKVKYSIKRKVIILTHHCQLCPSGPLSLLRNRVFLMLNSLLTPNHPVTFGPDCMCNYLLSGTICLINMSEHLLLSLLKQINAVFPQPWGIINREKKGSSKNTQKLIQ